VIDERATEELSEFDRIRPGQNRDKTTRAGFDAHLTKPADEAALAKSFAYPVTSGTRSTTRQ